VAILSFPRISSINKPRKTIRDLMARIKRGEKLFIRNMNFMRNQLFHLQTRLQYSIDNNFEIQKPTPLVQLYLPRPRSQRVEKAGAPSEAVPPNKGEPQCATRQVGPRVALGPRFLPTRSGWCGQLLGTGSR
jgi:hypothetical protein